MRINSDEERESRLIYVCMPEFSYCPIKRNLETGSGLRKERTLRNFRHMSESGAGESTGRFSKNRALFQIQGRPLSPECARRPTPPIT